MKSEPGGHGSMSLLLSAPHLTTICLLVLFPSNDGHCRCDRSNHLSCVESKFTGIPVVQETLDLLLAERRSILDNPAQTMRLQTKKLRQSSFKERYKLKQTKSDA